MSQSRYQSLTLTQLDLLASQLTGNQAEALYKLMPDCKIAMIKRYDGGPSNSGT